jgi:hypothetical protein
LCLFLNRAYILAFAKMSEGMNEIMKTSALIYKWRKQQSRRQNGLLLVSVAPLPVRVLPLQHGFTACDPREILVRKGSCSYNERDAALKQQGTNGKGKGE